MNVTNYQPTGVYKQFVKNPSLISNNFLAKGLVTPKQEDDKRDNKKKILMYAGFSAALILLFFGIRYYAKSLKILKSPEQDSLIGLSSTEYDLIDKNIYKAEYIKELEEKREIYTQCENGIVGRIGKVRKSISEFFREKFYNY